MGADTYSNTLGCLLMGTGNDNNTWGTNANAAVFQIFEDAIANSLTSSVSGGTLDLSGSAPPSGPSQVRYAALIFTGALAANQIVKVPNLTKWWWINNETSGAFTLTIETPSASLTGVIPQNSGWQVVQCDGSNNINVSPFNFDQIQMPDGSTAAPSHSFVNEPSSGLRRAGTQDLRVVVGGVDVFQITGSGASTPNVVNAMVGSLQQQGVQVVPPGTEVAFAGVNLPAGWLWEYGQQVSRNTYPDLFFALRAQMTGNVTNGSASITGVTNDWRNQGLEGSALEGTGLTGLTISSITSNTITLSGNATAGSGSAVTFYAYPYGNGDGTSTFNVPDRRGRVIAGRDNMGAVGASAAGRLTVSGSGINGIELTATGGSQNVTLAQANLGTSWSFPSTLTVGGTIGGSQTLTSIVGFGGPAAISLGAGSGGDFAGTENSSQTVNGSSFSFSGAITGGAVTSGGSGTPVITVQPTGIANYIIKT